MFFCLRSPISGVWWGLAGCLESCAILRLCSRVGETTAWGCSRSRFRDSAIPADVFWKGDRLSQAGPGPVPRTGAGWTSAVLVQGRRSCETALPTLAAVCGRTQGPGAKGEPHPCCAWDLHPPWEPAPYRESCWCLGCVSCHPTEHGQTCVRGHPSLSISLGQGGSHSLRLPQEHLSPSSSSTQCGCLLL